MTDATEMELRVAKRIGAYYGLHGKKNVLKHINVARAAIRAMRISTLEMSDAGDKLIDKAYKTGAYEDSEYVWTAMIDAASPRKITPTPFRLRPEKEIPPRRKALAKPK